MFDNKTNVLLKITKGKNKKNTPTLRMLDGLSNFPNYISVTQMKKTPALS